MIQHDRAGKGDCILITDQGEPLLTALTTPRGVSVGLFGHMCLAAAILIGGGFTAIFAMVLIQTDALATIWSEPKSVLALAALLAVGPGFLALSLRAYVVALRARANALVIDVFSAGIRIHMSHRHKRYEPPIWVPWSELDRIIWDARGTAGRVRVVRHGERRGTSMVSNGIAPEIWVTLDAVVEAAQAAGCVVQKSRASFLARTTYRFTSPKA